MMDKMQESRQSGARTGRQYYVDWLRIIAVLGVFVYHAVRPFSSLPHNINNAQTSAVVTFVFVIFLGSWGMPLFFLLAGAGSWFALDRRSGREFAAERFRRLLIPLVVGTVMLSPIELYLEWVHKGLYLGSFLRFIPVIARDRVAGLLARPSPSQFLAWGNHLWFVGYLFTFSLVALPLFLWLKGETGRKLRVRLDSVGNRRGGLLVFLVPIVAGRLAVQPFAPAYTDWTDFVYMFTYFVFGYLLFADERLVHATKRDGWLAVGLGAFTTSAMIAALLFAGGESWVRDPGVPGFYLAWSLVCVNSWCWTLAALSFGMRCLQSHNRWLDRCQEQIVPFYMLHSPTITAIAFFVVQWNAGIAAKLPVVLFGSFVATVGLCELLVRRFGPARVLFGMKPVRRPGASPVPAKEGTRSRSAKAAAEREP